MGRAVAPEIALARLLGLIGLVGLMDPTALLGLKAAQMPARVGPAAQGWSSQVDGADPSDRHYRSAWSNHAVRTELLVQPELGAQPRPGELKWLP